MCYHVFKPCELAHTHCVSSRRQSNSTKKLIADSSAKNAKKLSYAKHTGQHTSSSLIGLRTAKQAFVTHLLECANRLAPFASLVACTDGTAVAVCISLHTHILHAMENSKSILPMSTNFARVDHPSNGSKERQLRLTGRCLLECTVHRDGRGRSPCQTPYDLPALRL